MDNDENEELPLSATLRAALIALIWGVNFVVIKVGVSGMPPLMLAALRFLFSAFPAIFFVKRPDASWGRLAAYGLALGVGEFGLLFTAIKLGAPTGLSSILLQSQAFFTAILAAAFLKERLSARSLVGMALAAAGLLLFALAGQVSGMTPPLLGMILGAAALWALANVVARTMKGTTGLSLMVWSSLFTPVPLALLSLAFEGPAAIGAAFSGLGWLTIAALAYLVILSTLYGYGQWNALIIRYGASRIAPFSLMVPAVSVVASALVFGERFGLADAVGAALVFAGLLVHALRQGA
jgi:O-acetylserine/cysteine efflux transporter